MLTAEFTGCLSKRKDTNFKANHNTKVRKKKYMKMFV